MLAENGGGPWDGGPLTINPIYTLYSGYLLGPISPFKVLPGGLKQLGYHHLPYETHTKTHMAPTYDGF